VANVTLKRQHRCYGKCASTCSSCGKPAHRSSRSQPEIVCQECRRYSPAYLERRRRAASRQPLPEPKQVACPICGKTFQQSRGGQKYCSLGCRNRRPRPLSHYSEATRERRRQVDRERDKRRPRLHGRAVNKTCEGCGEPFRGRPSEQQRYCSRQCAARGARRKWPASRIHICECLICAKKFTSRVRRKRPTCSVSCGRREYNRRCRWPEDRQCGCGTPLPARSRNRCDTCLAATRRERRRRERQRGQRGKNRIRPGARREVYTLEQIARRDRYYCQLCRPKRRVAMTKVAPHPKAPTIDHVIPLAQGGDDTRDNVRLAHFLCNALRGDRGGGEQLRLMG